MIAQREIWEYTDPAKVWVGKYRNSHNLIHWHSDCELLYVEHGSIDIFCDGKSYRLTDGEMLFADSGQVHYMDARDDGTVLIVIIFGREILKPYIGDICLASPKIGGHYDIPKIYAALREILLRRDRFSGGEAAGIIISLMARIFRAEKLLPCKAASESTTRFLQLLDEVSEKIGYYTFSDAAAFMGMSKAYFSRYFHNAAGIPFNAYLSYMRTKQAISYIKAKNGLPMTEIADRCGFGTIRNFNRIFKRITGFTPSALPEDFELDESFVYPSESAFDPTLHDCELIESSDRTGV